MSARHVSHHSFRLEQLETRLTPAVVGYYDMSLGQGNNTQLAPIQQAGHTARLLTDLGPNDLVGVDVLFVQNPNNGAYGDEYLSRLTAVADFVASGKVLVLHDRYVDPAETILPGGGAFDIRRDSVGIGQVYELGLYADVHILERLRIRAGYTCLWAAGVSTAHTQVEYNLAAQGGKARDSSSMFWHGPLAELQFLF